ncbi:MAG: glycosyltransferase 87 family protein [Defluviitaleaceae bacterium]|nr:glycosyltransferase 87 family protein [Defluviitaleaceae bacterium]
MIWVLLGAGLIVRLFAFYSIDFMFENDIRTFQIWASQLATNGLGGFYKSGIWSDYPPGYLYILALSGVARGIFEWELLSPIFNFFTFLPAMLADVAIGYVIWRVSRKASRYALLFAALWLFNPAVILISSVWGQVESVFLLPLFVSLVLLREKRLLLSYILYGVAILIKPQSLFLGPVYLFSAFDYWRGHGFIWPELKRLGLYVSAALGGMLMLAFPFTQRSNYLPVFRQFWGGLDAYNFGTVNAFNLWALAERNWRPLDARFMGITHAAWGVIIAVAIVCAVFAALEINKRRGGGHYWLIVAAVFVLTFVFSVKMHERYLFPAILFLLLYAAEKPRWHTAGLFLAVCVTFFINCFAVLYAFNAGGNWWESPMMLRFMSPVSWVNIGIACGILLTMLWGVNRCPKK